MHRNKFYEVIKGFDETNRGIEDLTNYRLQVTDAFFMVFDEYDKYLTDTEMAAAVTDLRADYQEAVDYLYDKSSFVL